MLPHRLERLARHGLRGDLVVFEAGDAASRLLGLALLDELPDGAALLLRRCRLIHTFGMRFAIDVLFLDAHGELAKDVRGLAPRRMACCHRARHVLETKSGEADRFLNADALAGLAI